MNNLKKLRKAKRLTQQEMANFLGITQNAYSYWENDKVKIDNKSLEKLSGFFGVTVDYLLGRNTDLSGNDEKPAGVRIPVYGDTAAGVPILAIENYNSDDPDDWEEITQDMARQGEFIALRIKGDSMEPRMKTGDVVIVRLQPDIETGDVAIVRVNGDSATCKKVKKTPEGLWLIPFNPTHEPIFYSPKDIRDLPVTIIGKVVELRAKF